MRALIVVMLVATALSGCVGTDEAGSASFYVKDAPTDEFDEIHVVFTAIEVHQAGGNESADDSENETEAKAGWITTFESSGTDVDLLNASGAKAVFLGEAELETGKYTQIRIHATEAYGLKDGQRIEISLANDVLKVVKSFNVGDGETRIVLDFDLDRSLKQTGGPEGGWKMTPVIGKTLVTEVSDDESGSDVHEEGEVVELEEAA